MDSDFKWDEVHLSEEPADALLRELGYEFVASEVLDGERGSLAEAVVVRRLEAALRRLNPWINDDNVRKAVRAITHATATGLIEANEAVHTSLVHNISLEQDLGTGQRGQTVRFVDFDKPGNNEFVFTRQYRVVSYRSRCGCGQISHLSSAQIVYSLQPAKFMLSAS